MYRGPFIQSALLMENRRLPMYGPLSIYWPVGHVEPANHSDQAAIGYPGNFGHILHSDYYVDLASRCQTGLLPEISYQCQHVLGTGQVHNRSQVHNVYGEHVYSGSRQFQSGNFHQRQHHPVEMADSHVRITAGNQEHGKCWCSR